MCLPYVEYCSQLDPAYISSFHKKTNGFHLHKSMWWKIKEPLSVRGGGFLCVILVTGGSLSQHAPQVTWPGGSLSGGSLSKGLCPGGSLSGGSLSGGLCPGRVSLSRGSLLGRPPYGNERAVRILLECILIQNENACNLFWVWGHATIFLPITVTFCLCYAAIFTLFTLIISTLISTLISTKTY